uniref:COesterase domain-containing protein n=1 Tax=Steinernema glaseri TaxID=37863 RepID=A0A1I7ZUM4_9BILA
MIAQMLTDFWGSPLSDKYVLFHAYQICSKYAPSGGQKTTNGYLLVNLQVSCPVTASFFGLGGPGCGTSLQQFQELHEEVPRGEDAKVSQHTSANERTCWRW